MIIVKVELLDTKEAAKILGYSPLHARRLCRWGVIPAQKAGRDWFITRDAINQYKGGANVKNNAH